MRGLLRSVVDALPAMVTVRDGELRYTLVNRTFATFFKTTPDGCMGRRFEDICADDQAVAASTADSLTAMLDGWSNRSRQWSCRGPDGEITHFVTILLPRIDETGRQRDVISVKDAEGRYVLIDRASEESYNVDRRRVLGSTISQVVGSGQIPHLPSTGSEADWYRGIENRERQVVATGAPLTPYEVLRSDSAGRPRTHLVLKVPFADEAGRITGVVTVAVDVTELKASRRAALEAKEMAELANRSKSDFLANMSHERYRDYAHHVVESGNHLLSLIGDILDIASIDLGRVELGEEPVDLAAVIRTCLMMLRDKAVAGGVTIDTGGLDGLPRLLADRRRMLQILTNLVGNAVKFTPPGGRVAVAGPQAFGPQGPGLNRARSGSRDR